MTKDEAQVDKCPYGMWRCDMYHRCEHPPKWQGLTDDEINQVCLEMFETPAAQGDLKFGYAIEQALKEKNKC